MIVTADHGEELFEHGDLGHGLTLFDEAVRVPLVVLGPGVAAGVVHEGIVGGIDLAPTIAGRLGVPVPTGAFQGRRLPTEGAAPPDAARALVLEGPWLGYVERDRGPVARVSRAVVRGDVEIVSRENVRGEAPWRELEVFDPAHDPGERSGHRIDAIDPRRSADDAERVALFEASVADALAVAGPAVVPAATLPPDDARRLEALGYLPP